MSSDVVAVVDATNVHGRVADVQEIYSAGDRTCAGRVGVRVRDGNKDECLSDCDERHE